MTESLSNDRNAGPLTHYRAAEREGAGGQKVLFWARQQGRNERTTREGLDTATH